MIKTILYHYRLSPFCRKIRVMLAEKGCLFELDDENIPVNRLGESPRGEPPLLIELVEATKKNNNENALEKHFPNTHSDLAMLSGDIEYEENYIFDHEVIAEYIEEKYSTPQLMGNDISERAEIRRLCRWFDEKFYSEVGGVIITEKLEKRLAHTSPDSVRLGKARKNLKDHLFYISHLLRKNDRLLWLVSPNITMADITAAAHLSVLDYFGEINWNGDTEKNVIDYMLIRDWYARIKSRQSFKPLLLDRVMGIPPASTDYSKLDF